MTKFAQAILESCKIQPDEFLINFEALINAFSPFFATIKGLSKKQQVNLIGELNIEPFFIALLKVFIEYKKFSQLPLLLASLQKENYRRKGFELVELVYSHPPSEDQKKLLIDFLLKKFQQKVYFDVRTDPELLAGFIVKYRGKMLDYSLNSSLNRIKKL